VTRLGDEGEELVGGGRSEDLPRLERQLEGGAAQMRDQDVQVVRVEARLLGSTVEEEVRVVDDIAVDGRTRRDEDRDARLPAPTGPSDLLPGRRDRTRIAGEDRDVEPADIDAKLESVRCDDPEELAVAETTFD
jgi:hypothetical protein